MTEAPPSHADHAFLLACRALGHDPAQLAEWLAPAWRDRLGRLPEGSAGPARSLAPLQDRLRQEARPDWKRIHPSWWVRALQDESSVVRRAVVAYGPEAIRERLRNELELRREDIVPAGEPHPDAVSCVLALWAEPFVGGPPLTEDDPPIVRALAGLGRHEVTRLVALAGLAKLAVIPKGPQPSPASERIAARLAAFHEAWREPDPRWIEQARRDVAATRGHLMANLPRLGLITAGRLLGRIDATRARWALQHLPYGIARAVRPSMDEMASRPADRDPREAWESRVLDLALRRLAEEPAREAPS